MVILNVFRENIPQLALLKRRKERKRNKKLFFDSYLLTSNKWASPGWWTIPKVIVPERTKLKLFSIWDMLLHWRLILSVTSTFLQNRKLYPVVNYSHDISFLLSCSFVYLKHAMLFNHNRSKHRNIATNHTIIFLSTLHMKEQNPH